MSLQQQNDRDSKILSTILAWRDIFGRQRVVTWEGLADLGTGFRRDEAIQLLCEGEGDQERKALYIVLIQELPELCWPLDKIEKRQAVLKKRFPTDTEVCDPAS